MRDDALPVGRLLLAAGSILGTIAAVIAAVALLLHLRGLPAGGMPVARPAPPPDGRPALQPAPQDELAAVRRAQSAELGRWSRPDGAGGVARVPVEVALDRLAVQAASAPGAEDRP
jgi:hypothetical protein